MGPTVEHYRFDAWDLPTKHGWMHSGPGVQAATSMQDVASRMAERMITSGELVGRLLSGTHWAGEAAGAAGWAMRRGAGQITQTAAEAATAQRCVTELGESFLAARNRVPSPNEIPTGLGDRFLYGAAEGLNALSPFVVQSPLHDAMTQRRELDQQANLALANHMSTSRDRVEAIPTVTPPAPMVVAGRPPGEGGRQPTGMAPTTAWFSGPPAATATPMAATPLAAVPPAATTAAGWAGVPDAPVTGPGSGAGGAPTPPGAGPVSTGLVSTIGGRIYRPRLGTAQPTGAGAGPGSAILSPSASGDGAAARTRAGFGTRPESARPSTGRDGIAHPGAPERDGPVRGTATPGPRTVGISSAGISGRADPASFLQPPVSSRSDDDTEHKNRYAQQAEHIVGELPLVAPPVIGETPAEQRHRLNPDRR